MNARGGLSWFGIALAVAAILTLTSDSSAQIGGSPPTSGGSTSGGTTPSVPDHRPTWLKNAQSGGTAGNMGFGSGAASTTPGGPGAGGGFAGGSGSGFGTLGLLTPEQEFLVLLNTVTIVDELLQVVQPSSELEILFLFLIVYFDQYRAAVDALLGGGTGTGVSPAPGGTTSSPPTTTGTTGPTFVSGVPGFNNGVRSGP